MYIVVKQYRLWILWKYYKIIDISTTLFVFALHTIISKLPLIIFSVCFYQFWFNTENQTCLAKKKSDDIEDKIKPPIFIITLHYITFVINCWVVYYKFLWKNGEVIYRIGLSLHGNKMMIAKNENGDNNNNNNNKWWRKFSIYPFVVTNLCNEPLLLLLMGAWVHFISKAFSIIRDDTIVERLHIAVSMILLFCTACQHIIWQKRAKLDWIKKQKKIGVKSKKNINIKQSTPDYGVGIIFLFIGLLMFKLLLV